MLTKCMYCGCTFEGNSIGRPRKYCSSECYNQAMLKKKQERRVVERICEYCGKNFNANGKYKYCSSECYTKAHQDQMNKRNSYRWYNDKEYRKRQLFIYCDGLGTIKFQENDENDWEKESIMLKALKKKAGL